jgi:hypothetical protein
MAAMRVSDQEYTRDERTFHLAVRMMRHEARTNTVCAWTGFTEERVRNLSRSQHRYEKRRQRECRRGPSPKTLAPLLATASLRSEVAALAGLCRLLRVLPDEPLPNARKCLPTVTLGERLCEVFEFYQEMVPFARLTFEQLVFLVFTLAEGRICTLEFCTRCPAVILLDHLSVPAQHLCVHCQLLERTAAAKRSAKPGANEPASSNVEDAPEPPGFQRRLFE